MPQDPGILGCLQEGSLSLAAGGPAFDGEEAGFACKRGGFAMLLGQDFWMHATASRLLLTRWKWSELSIINSTGLSQRSSVMVVSC